MEINIAEILKNCPKGMELDCLLCNSPIALEGVAGDESTYPIKAVGKDGFHHVFTKYGTSYNHDDAKCTIFPKGKTTWEGFQGPFKDGDVISTNAAELIVISIFKEFDNNDCNTYIDYSDELNKLYTDTGCLCNKENINEQRLATKEEKQKLFDAIKANGYKWNPDNKTLEKLVEHKFKVGDKINHKTHISQGNIVTEIKDTYYILDDKSVLSFIFQDEYELVSDKFDITTLKPFDKVLVRGDTGQKWTHDFFGFMDKDKGHPFVCVGHYVIQCIPYEGNEHLLGTINNCEEYFKTWK